MLLTSKCLEYLFPILCTEVISISDVEVCFLDTPIDWILFFHIFYWSVLLYWGIETIDIKSYQQPKIVEFSYFIVIFINGDGGGGVCVCMCMFPIFLFSDVRLFICSVFMGVLRLGFSSSTFCMTGFVDKYCLS